MSPVPKSKPVQQIPTPPQRSGIDAAVEECLQRTATLLLETGAASRDDLVHVVHQTRAARSHGNTGDLLENLALHLGHQEERLAEAVARYAEKIASKLSPHPPSIPFASRFVDPATFYDNFPEIRKLGHALLAPVIYAEDSDAIGTGSINPIAAMILGEEIQAAVSRRFEVNPFVTSVILEYPSWRDLTRKQFQR